MVNDIQCRLEQIYNNYLNIVCRQTLRYESLANEFPTGVLNEIRSTFTHIAIIGTRKVVDIEHELQLAEGHMKRAIRDCYKYNCVAYENSYIIFHNNFVKDKYTNDCLIQIEEEHDKAINHMILARGREIKINYSNDINVDNNEFDNYEKAILHFELMYSLIHSTK